MWMSACQTPVASGLSEQDADALVEHLATSGVWSERASAARTPGAFRVEVGREDLEAALRVVQSLPQASSEPRGLEGPELAALIPSRDAEYQRRLDAAAERVETSLRAMGGAVDARVHLAGTPPKRFGGGSDAPKASVLISHRGQPPDEASIRRLVAGSVPELRPEQVDVVYDALTAPPPLDWVRLGPFTMTRASSSLARVLLLVLVALQIALVGALLYVWRRSRRISLEVAARSRSETSSSSEAP
jgi:type III secretory pathway lipoprotein EscJ